VPLRKPKRHHFVPRFYLRGFADQSKPDAVWVYEKGGVSPKLISVHNTALEKDFYSFREADGSVNREKYEGMLAEIENTCAPIIRKLTRRERIDSDKRVFLALFAAAMAVRVPRFRSEVLRSIADQIGAIERARQDRTRLHRVVVDRGLLLDMSFHGIFDLTDHLGALSWVYIEAPPGSAFVTSDCPLTISDIDTEPGLLLATDLLNPLAQIAFPLTSTIALTASWKRHGDAFGIVDDDDVQQINMRTILFATRYVYATEHSERIAAFVNDDRLRSPEALADDFYT
jgi:hypothetical protein